MYPALPSLIKCGICVDHGLFIFFTSILGYRLDLEDKALERASESEQHYKKLLSIINENIYEKISDLDSSGRCYYPIVVKSSNVEP